MNTAVESLRSAGASFLALLSVRVELALVELREEAERRKELAVLGAAAGVLLTLAALLFAILIIVAAWDAHRMLAAGAVTAVYFTAGLAVLVRLRRRKREMPPPFEATLAELARDVEALRSPRHE